MQDAQSNPVLYYPRLSHWDPESCETKSTTRDLRLAGFDLYPMLCVLRTKGGGVW